MGQSIGLFGETCLAFDQLESVKWGCAVEAAAEAVVVTVTVDVTAVVTADFTDVSDAVCSQSMAACWLSV